ncbi:MAG: hypothetical protein ACMXYC_00430 [Candidatus Woesearchaeota archaeon]
MKHTFKDNKTVFVTPESEEDIWTLYSIIQKNDIITSKTIRKIKLGEQQTKVITKTITLSIMVTKQEFLGQSCRVLGTVHEGTQDVPKGDHHSFTIQPFDSLHITKEIWPAYLKDKLKTAPQQQVLLCLFDREQALFATLSSNRYDITTTLQGKVAKKGDDTVVQNTFFKEIAQLLTQEATKRNLSTVILASPAFWTEYLKKELPTNNLTIITSAVHDVGVNGIQEILKRPELHLALSQHKIIQEQQSIEQFITDLSCEKPICYGCDDVYKATKQGAVKKVLVSEQYIMDLRMDNKEKELEELLYLIEQQQGTIQFIGNHDKKVHGFGGIVAFLRFALQDF